MEVESTKAPDVRQLQNHLRADQFELLKTSIAKFIRLNDDPSVSVSEVKSSRTIITKLLSRYADENTESVAKIERSLAENEENSLKLIETMNEIKVSLEENDGLLKSHYNQYNIDSHLPAYRYDQLEIHIGTLQKHFNEITKLRNARMSLQQQLQLRKQDAYEITLGDSPLENDLINRRNNSSEIALFKGSFIMSYTDQSIEAKHKKDGNNNNTIVMIPDDNQVIVPIDNVVSKKPRTQGPGIEPPPKKMLAESIDPVQCIYRKSANTLVKFIPPNLAMFYIEMENIDGFVKIIEPRNLDEFPVDTYEICTDMNPTDKVTQLTLSDNIHGLPIDGNHMEKFCILYELLHTLQAAYKENGFRYNRRNYDTLKYERVVNDRSYEAGKILCSSKKKVLITDLSRSKKELTPSKRGRLDARDVTLFLALIRQLRIPNFTHKIIALLTKPVVPLIVDFTENKKPKDKKKKQGKKKDGEKKDKKGKKEKKDQYIRFDAFINAIGDAWLDHNFQ